MSRTATGYEPRFDIDYSERGVPGEKAVANMRDAIANQRIEVKTDYGLAKTGNLYIEFEQKLRSGEWVPSGVKRSEAELWAFSSPTHKGALIVATPTLVEVCETIFRESPEGAHTDECKAGRKASWHSKPCVGCCPHENAQTRPTHGVKLPLNVLMAHAWNAQSIPALKVPSVPVTAATFRDIEALTTAPFDPPADLPEGVDWSLIDTALGHLAQLCKRSV